MANGELLSVAEVHVHTAGQAGIEAPHGAHDVDALELLTRALLEKRRAGDGVLVWPLGPERVPRARVPGRRRIGMVIGDLLSADDQMMGQDAADGLVEA